MATILYKNGDVTQSAVVELIADLRSDIVDLETDYMAGSTCLVVEDSSVWVLGPDQEWHELS